MTGMNEQALQERMFNIDITKELDKIKPVEVAKKSALVGTSIGLASQIYQNGMVPALTYGLPATLSYTVVGGLLGLGLGLGAIGLYKLFRWGYKKVTGK